MGAQQFAAVNTFGSVHSLLGKASTVELAIDPLDESELLFLLGDSGGEHNLAFSFFSFCLR